MTNTMVMRSAWDIARKGQSRFGGSVKEYFAEALRIAWAIIKKRKDARQVKLSKFDQFRFEGLDVRQRSNKYYELNRVTADEKKIVIKISDSHLIQTRYGYAMILDEEHVVFLKEWQVNRNYYGNEVILNKDFFNVKKWGQHHDFFIKEENYKWETWLEIAKEQEMVGNKALWQK